MSDRPLEWKLELFELFEFVRSGGEEGALSTGMATVREADMMVVVRRERGGICTGARRATTGDFASLTGWNSMTGDSGRMARRDRASEGGVRSQSRACC